MSVDFSKNEDVRAPEGDGALFAPTPVWARTTTKKRRGFGGGSNTTTTTTVAHDRSLDAAGAGPGAGLIGATAADEAVDAPYATTYDSHSVRRTDRSRMIGPALVAGVAAIALIGGFSWYASQPHDSGMAQLTPGAPATTQTAMNTPTAADVTAAGTMAATPAAAPAPTMTQHATTTVTRTATPAPATVRSTHVATRSASATRVRPATTSSATEVGVDASATAPVVNTPAPAPSASSATVTTASPAATSPMTVNPAPGVTQNPTTTPAPAPQTAPTDSATTVTSPTTTP